MKCKHNPYYQKSVNFMYRNNSDMRNLQRNAFLRFYCLYMAKEFISNLWRTFSGIFKFKINQSINQSIIYIVVLAVTLHNLLSRNKV